MKFRFFKKHPRLSIGIGLVAILAIFLLSKGNTHKVTYAYVKRGDIAQTVLVSGNVLSNGQTPIYSPTTGVITALFVQNGDMVVSGEKIASIHSTASDQDKKKAYAAYVSALNAQNASVSNKSLVQSQLEAGRLAIITANTNLNNGINNRAAGLNNPTTGHGYTQDDIDGFTSALTSARENFASLEKQFENTDTAISAAQSSAQAALSVYQATKDSIITSPTDGTVANLAYMIGDKVNASSTDLGAQVTPLFILADFSKASILTSVNETSIGKLHPDLPAQVTFDAIPNTTYTAHINRIDSVGTNTQGVITYNVYFNLDSFDSQVKTGMTANIMVESATHTNVLLVPNTAFTLENGIEVVLVRHANKTVSVPVTVGIRGEQFSEVTNGVSEGDQIVIEQ